MAIPADIDPSQVRDTPTVLDPAETLPSLDNFIIPTPVSLDDMLSPGIEVGNPAPQTRGGLQEEQRTLRIESQTRPPETLAPSGFNPRIDYGKSPEVTSNPVVDTLAQGGIGILQGGAQIGRKAFGASSLITGGNPQSDEAAKLYAASERGLEETGQEMGGVPGVRQVVSNVVGTSPELLAGSIGGLPAIAASFGLGAAGSSYEDAKQAEYPHPEAYALLSGLIAAGTSLIPGYKGRNLVAAGNELVNSPSWAAYTQNLLKEYDTNFLNTHGGSTALMMGVQSILQGTLNQQTVDPNLTWKDIVVDAANSAGFGAIIGEGFGALGQAAHLSTRKAQVGNLLKTWSDQIEKSQLQDFRGLQPGHEQQIRRTSWQYPPDNAEDESTPYEVAQRNLGSLRLPPEMGAQSVSPAGTPPENLSDESTPYEVAQRNSPPVATITPTPKQEPLEARVAKANAAEVPGLQAEVTSAFRRGVLSDEEYQDLITTLVDKVQPAAHPAIELAKQADVRFMGEQLPQVPGMKGYWQFNLNGENASYTFNTPVGATLEQVKEAKAQKLAQLTPIKNDVGPAPYAPPSERPVTSNRPPVPPKPKARGSLRVAPANQPPTPAPTGPHFPKIGETIPIGNFIITRPRGNIVLSAEEGGPPIATLRKPDLAALNPKAILDDMVRVQRGEKTAYWEFTGRGMKVEKTEVRKEAVFGDPAKLQEEVQGALGGTPEEVALHTAIRAGAMTPELMVSTLNELRDAKNPVKKQKGEAVAAKGPKAIAKGLTEVLRSKIQDYLKGTLLERDMGGTTGKTPPELLKPDGTLKTQEEILATFGNPVSLASRVLDIVLGERAVMKEEVEKAKNVAPQETEEGPNKAIEAYQNPTAVAPVNKSGFTDEEVVTKFSDEDLNTSDKRRAADRVNAIKEDVLAGDAKDYDEGVEILQKTFGFSKAKAEDWMDSETNFMSPPDNVMGGKGRQDMLDHGGEYQTGGNKTSESIDSGKLRPATAADFPNLKNHALYEKWGFLNAEPVTALERIAASDQPIAPLAKFFLQFRAELQDVSMGNLGGNSRAVASYNPDNNSIRLSIPTVPGDTSVESRVLENFMHEVGHALLVKRLEVLTPDHPLWRELNRIMEVIKQRGSGEYADYAKSSPHELLTMALTNPETIELLATTKDPTKSGTLWDQFKDWVKRVLFGDNTSALKSTGKLIDQILERPRVDKVDWLESQGRTFDYPDIRKPKQYEEASGYQPDLTPIEEKELLTRKAVAQNIWLKAEDVQSHLNALPDNVQPLVKTIIGQRLAVLDRVRNEPGAEKGSSLKGVWADPSVPLERKYEMTTSALANLLWFKRQAELLDARTQKKAIEFVTIHETLDKGINESNMQVLALDGAIDRLVDEFKASILADKERATDATKVEELTRMVALADELKGNRRTALGRFMESLSQKIDLETLLSTEDPKALLEIIRKAFPVSPETAQATGASEETMRLASILMARSNTLREELLTLKLVKDQEIRKGIFAINSEINEQIRNKTAGRIIDEFTKHVTGLNTARARQWAIYKQLYRNKIGRLQTLGRMSMASKALADIQQTRTFKDLDQLITDKVGLMMPQRGLLPRGQIEYRHPIERTPVTIGTSFEKAGEVDNLQKLSDLVDAAQSYISDVHGENYTPAEAAFWKHFVAHSAPLLDPSLSVNARKLVSSGLDPYKALRVIPFAESFLLIPDQVFRRIGGRAANDLNVGYQALATVDSQVSNLVQKWWAPIGRLANKAAKAHGMPIETWHTEVLNPLIASRQTTGYAPIKPGNKNLYGHTLLPEDEAAFQVQKEFDRALVKVATTGHGFPAVTHNPSKITFEHGDKTLTRQVVPSGPDTMSRRISQWATSLATQWANATSVKAQKELMDANFSQMVMGHIYNAGAPDYSIKSMSDSLYKRAYLQHLETPIENTAQLLDVLFEKQADLLDPDHQLSKDMLFDTLSREFSKIFKNVANYHDAAPKPEVGSMLRVVGTDNSFTEPRGHLIAPSSFYEYGLTFDRNMIMRAHSAKAFYAMEIAGKNGLLDRAMSSVQARATEFENQIKSQGQKVVKAGSKEAQLRGDSILDYDQTLVALRQLQILRKHLDRVLLGTDTVNDPDARQFASSAQSLIASQLLAGTSQVMNAFGGLGNLMLLDKFLLGRSGARATAQLGIRALLTRGPTELAALLAKTGAGHKVLDALKSPQAPALFNWLGDVIDARIQLHNDMESVGLAPAANFAQDMMALFEMPSSGGRPQPRSTGVFQSGVRASETAMNLVSTPFKAIAPRLVDRFINELTVWKARDIEDLLRTNAAKFGDIRTRLMAGTGVEGQRAPFTSEEITRSAFNKGSQKQHILLKEVFDRQHMSLDNLMWRYYDNWAKAVGDKAKDSVQFFTPEERSAFQYSLAQDVNLPTMANRPWFSRGSRIRNAIGLFHGYPAWQASRLSDLMAKTSADKSSYKYWPNIITSALTLAALGAASIKVTKELKHLFYNELDGYPDIIEAKNFNDALKALTVGLFTYVPFVGNMVNGYLNQQIKNGFDINSQFVMLNFANDLRDTMLKMFQEHTVVRPVEDFIRRWSPLARVVINQLPNQSGLTEYYNLSREMKNLAPEGMETRRKGKGAVDVTPATPYLQDLVNAAYKNDIPGFFKATQDYIAYEVSTGISPEQAMQNLKASWRGRHPFVREFGRMPTVGEEAVIFQNATPEQRQMLNHANQVWETFGAMLGTSVSLVSNGPTGTSEAMVIPGTGAEGGGGSGGRSSSTGSLLVPWKAEANYLSPSGSGSGGGANYLTPTGGRPGLLGSSTSGGGATPSAVRGFRGPAGRTQGSRPRVGGGSLRIKREAGMKLRVTPRFGGGVSGSLRRAHSGKIPKGQAPRAVRRLLKKQ